MRHHPRRASLQGLSRNAGAVLLATSILSPSFVLAQEGQADRGPPAGLTAYEFRGDTVYYRPARCCDIPSTLYDARGNVVCHPDGGITGRGDGRCPNFFDEARKLEVLPPGSDPLEAHRGELDRRSFRLRAREGEFWIVHRRDSIPVPRDWLIPPEEADAEEGAYVSSFEYDSLVTAFPVTRGFTGLHLSSYAIGSGSAQAAAGRDAFLLLERGSHRLRPGILDLGVTKSRGRVMGCWTARTHHFLLGDVDGDRRTDLGIVEEEISCMLPQGERPPGPYYRQATIRWHVFGRSGWTPRPEYDGRLPAGYRRLPLIGLESTPVTFVKSILRRGGRRSR